MTRGLPWFLRPKATWDGLRKNSPSNSYILSMGQADLGIRLWKSGRSFRTTTRFGPWDDRLMSKSSLVQVRKLQIQSFPDRLAGLLPTNFYSTRTVVMYPCTLGGTLRHQKTQNMTTVKISVDISSLLQSPWSTSWVARPANEVPCMLINSHPGWESSKFPMESSASHLDTTWATMMSKFLWSSDHHLRYKRLTRHSKKVPH